VGATAAERAGVARLAVLSCKQLRQPWQASRSCSSWWGHLELVGGLAAVSLPSLACPYPSSLFVGIDTRTFVLAVVCPEACVEACCPMGASVCGRQPLCRSTTCSLLLFLVLTRLGRQCTSTAH
jgi:hypothetical protein